jgi:NADH dehydrogenase (ubiquinone) Fe-S protein 8
MAPTLPASAAAMLARRQLTRAPASASSLMMATRMLATPVHQQQQRGYATPKGALPQNFRTSKPVEWAWEKDSLLDRLGKYFLMTEMARGMYVLLEQFFRPPYVISMTHIAKMELGLLTEDTQLHHLLSFRKGTQVARR